MRRLIPKFSTFSLSPFVSLFLSLNIINYFSTVTGSSNPRTVSPSNSAKLFPLSTPQQYGDPLTGNDSTGPLKWQLRSENGSVNIGAWFPSLAHLDLMRDGVVDSPDVGLNEGTERWIAYENWTYTASLEPWIRAGEGSDEKSLKGYEKYLLIFDGLDTVCNITVGDQPVAWVNNMFRRWEFDITPQLTSLISSPKAKNTNLTLTFQSALTYAQNLSTQPGAEFLPTGWEITGPVIQSEYSWRNWIRKQQSDFGWDWGPAYAPQGPHKQGWIVGLGSTNATDLNNTVVSHDDVPYGDGEGFQLQRKILSNVSDSGVSTSKPANNYISNGIYVSTTSIDIYREGQTNNLPPSQTAPWILNLTLSLWSTTSYSSPSISMSLEGTKHSSSDIKLTAIREGWNNNLAAVWKLPGDASKGERGEAPELWWPSNMGTPKLYQLNVHFSSGQPEHQNNRDGSDNEPIEIEWKERTGFRTVVLNQEKYTSEEVKGGIQPGTKFQFEINGKPFYVQGSNIIPFDTFFPRITKDAIKWYIQSALLANQNMLRAWGGGSHQTDEFYDLCDEMGILVWSENIAAVELYPIADWYVSNMVEELEENVRRINRHPSNALWSGNNEIEEVVEALAIGWLNGSTYVKEYGEIFEKALRGAVLRNSKSISYIPSSTTSGYFSLDPYIPRYLAQVPGENYGDKEHYDYDTSHSLDVNTYPAGRFVVEFGFHSMASIYSYDTVLTSPDQYTFNGIVVADHDRHSPPPNDTYPYFPADGQSQLSEGVKSYLPTPSLQGQMRKEFAQWAYSTQIFQAAFMSAQIAFYRLGASRPEHNLGSLYWQLNDEANWTGATWAAIESIDGRWKILQYLAQRTQSHVIVNPIWWQESQTFEIWVTSDMLDDIVEGEVSWTWYDFKGNTLGSGHDNTTTKPFTVKGIDSVRLFQSPPLATLWEAILGHHDPKDAWVHLELNGTTVLSNSSNNKPKSFYNEQFFQPIPLKSSPLSNPNLSIKPLASPSENLFLIENNGEGVAAWVNVEHPPGITGWFSEPARMDLPSNDFYLRPGERRILKFNFKEGGGKDTEKGGWGKEVVVRSVWDNTH